jgi:hypothetical protein
VAVSQRRPYCASVNTHTPVGLVSWQCVAQDRAWVVCWRHGNNNRASRSVNLHQCACPFYSSHAGFLGKILLHQGLSAPLQPRFGSLLLLVFPRAKITVESEEICDCEGHTVHKLSQQRLTADLLSPRDNDSSRMRSKVTSDWLPSYIKAT